MITVKQWIMTPKFKLHYEATLPGKRAVCHQCNGDGMMENPAIGVLTEHDLEDADFREALLEGRYDIRCECCQGNKVIDVLDWDALTPKMQKAVETAEAQQRADDADAAGERRMGA